MPTNQERNYIFLDESGKPEIFSAKGRNLVESGQATKFLILAAVRTKDQLLIQQQITELKSSLFRETSLMEMFSPSYTLDAFHAQSDYPEVRKQFYKFINTLTIKIDVLVVEKLKCYSALQHDPARLYGVMAGQLLKNLLHQSTTTEVIFSRKDSKLKLRDQLEIEVERVRLGYLETHPRINPKLKLSYKHNPHYTHGGLQIADYIAYVIFQFYEHNNDIWYKIVQNKIGKIHDICNKKYLTKSNPLQLSH